MQSSAVTAKDFQVFNPDLTLLSTQRESTWKRNIFWPLDDLALSPQGAAAFPSEWLSLFPMLNVYETLLILLRALLTWDLILSSFLTFLQKQGKVKQRDNSSSCAAVEGQIGYSGKA